MIIPKELEPLAREARKFKSAEEFAKANLSSSKWRELQKQNPDLFKTGILRKDIQPYGVLDKDRIPNDIHTAQGNWQNYGQYDEIPAKTIYDTAPSDSHKYVDNTGKKVLDSNGYELEDNWNPDTQEWTEVTIPNKRLKDSLLETFSTDKGKKHLKKIVDALPKNPDGSITAYRIGVIGEKGAQSYTLSEGMAKTFSNQGTDVLPGGTPGLPREGYKYFGLLPVNMVKIDTKGIVAYNPYDAEILVDSKYVKTKSQFLMSKGV